MKLRSRTAPQKPQSVILRTEFKRFSCSFLSLLPFTTRRHELFKKRGLSGCCDRGGRVGRRGKERKRMHDDSLGEKVSVISGGSDPVADDLQAKMRH